MSSPTDHWKLAKEQVAHVLFGSCAFVTVAVVAIALDLFSGYIATLPITAYTSTIIAWVSHIMLAIDAVLFLAFVVMTSLDLLKGMKK